MSPRLKKVKSARFSTPPPDHSSAPTNKASIAPGMMSKRDMSGAEAAGEERPGRARGGGRTRRSERRRASRAPPRDSSERERLTLSRDRDRGSGVDGRGPAGKHARRTHLLLQRLDFG